MGTVSRHAVWRLVAMFALLAATAGDGSGYARAAPAEQVTCPPLMTTFPDGHVELRCQDATPSPTVMPSATATTTPPATATGTSVPPTPTPVVSGFTHGIFDDANVHDAQTFGAMISDVKPRGITAIMLTNGSFEHNAALLAVSDQMGMDVYLGAPEITTEFCCWGSDLEYARGLAGRFLYWYAGHPSFRGYYLYDEPDTDYADMARTLAQALKEQDAGRGRFIVATSIDARLNVYDPAQMSPFVVDAYPFSTGTAHCDLTSPQGRFAGFNYSGFLDEALARSGRPAATPFWLIGQTHGGGDTGLRQPDAEEVRAQYRVAREHGASGMFWFVYTSQQGWTGLKDNPTLMAAVTALAQGQAGGSSCGGSDTPTPVSTITATSTATLPPTATQPPTPTTGPTGNGVPTVPLNYAETVDQFWARHPANSSATGYVASLGNPGAIVNVNPSTIAAALSGPCQAECTLLLADGNYGEIHLIGRSNIHFRGINRAGARIRSATVVNCAMEIDAGGGGTGSYTALNEGLANNDPAAQACFTNRGGNISFKNLTFDGGDQPVVWNDTDHRVNGAAFWVRSLVGVWLEDVTVTGYKDGGSVHDGAIGGNARIDNVVLRRIRFDTLLDRGPSTYAFFDGCHACAILDSETGFSRAGSFTYFVNDDFTEDLFPPDGQWTNNELRLSNYVVIRGNIVHGEQQAHAFAVQGRNALIENNTTEMWATMPVLFQTRKPFNHPEGMYAYQHFGHRVRNNTWQKGGMVHVAFSVPDYCTAGATPDQCLQFGDIVVENNHMPFKDDRYIDVLRFYLGNVRPDQGQALPPGYAPKPPVVVQNNT